MQEHGGIQFPDSSIKLPQFSRPENIPHIKLPAAFISAARRRVTPGATHVATEDDTMLEVVNVVMNNIEDHLTITRMIRSNAKER